MSAQRARPRVPEGLRKCPCGHIFPDEGVRLVFRRVFSVRGIFPEHYCPCGGYHYTRHVYERPRMGRPRLGKTNQRSKTAKKRRNGRRNNARRGRTRYRFTGTHLLENVLEFGSPKNWEKRLAYHKARYAKAGRPWEERPKPQGFRLLNMRRYDLPEIVARAIIRIYDTPPILEEKRRKREPKRLPPSSRVRTPMSRDRTAIIGFLENQIYLARSAGDKQAHKRLQARLQVEVDIQYGRPHPTWDGVTYARVAREIIEQSNREWTSGMRQWTID